MTLSCLIVFIHSPDNGVLALQEGRKDFEPTEQATPSLVIPMQLSGNSDDVVHFSTNELYYSDKVSSEIAAFCDQYNIIPPHCTRLAAVVEGKLPPNPSASMEREVDLFAYDATSSAGDFAKMAKTFGTDKYSQHGYHRFYPRFLETFRHTILHQQQERQQQERQQQQQHDGSVDSTTVSPGMLEIGMDQYMSLYLWLEYFPDVFIYGIDIGTPPSQGPRYLILQIDQGDAVAMDAQLSKAVTHPLFLISDDGSHQPKHQLISFELLFNKYLQPGGLYIIEDIEFSYYRQRKDLDRSAVRADSVIEVFKALADDVNREFLDTHLRDDIDKKLSPYLSMSTRNAVSSVTFAHNCVLVLKKATDEYSYFHREYRYAGAQQFLLDGKYDQQMMEELGME